MLEGQKLVIKTLTFQPIISSDGVFMPISDGLQIEILLTLGFPVLWLLELPQALRRHDCFHLCSIGASHVGLSTLIMLEKER